MHYSPTLTADEFKELHNALCELSSLSDPTVRKLVEHIRTAALGRVYEEEGKDFQRRMDYYRWLQDTRDFKAVWSMFEIENLDTPHPFEGATKLIYKEHWGNSTVEVALGDDRTWLALYAAADEAIALSGDEHHVFIEDFTPVPHQPGVLELQTGS